MRAVILPVLLSVFGFVFSQDDPRDELPLEVDSAIGLYFLQASVANLTADLIGANLRGTLESLLRSSDARHRFGPALSPEDSGMLHLAILREHIICTAEYLPYIGFDREAAKARGETVDVTREVRRVFVEICGSQIKQRLRRSDETAFIARAGYEYLPWRPDWQIDY